MSENTTLIFVIFSPSLLSFLAILNLSVIVSSHSCLSPLQSNQFSFHTSLHTSLYALCFIDLIVILITLVYLEQTCLGSTALTADVLEGS